MPNICLKSGALALSAILFSLSAAQAQSHGWRDIVLDDAIGSEAAAKAPVIAGVPTLIELRMLARSGADSSSWSGTAKAALTKAYSGSIFGTDDTRMAVNCGATVCEVSSFVPRSKLAGQPDFGVLQLAFGRPFGAQRNSLFDHGRALSSLIVTNRYAPEHVGFVAFFRRAN